MVERQSSSEARQERAKRFLIVVDGNSRDSSYTGLLLQQFGYNVCTLQTVQQAMEIMAIALPALIITELALPGANGLDLLTQVRKNSRTASIPVIILTTVSDSQVEQRCEQAGCAVYLKKPVQSEDLYRAVQAVIEETPRMSMRISTNLRAVIGGTLPPGDASQEGYVTALSENGMFVKTMKPHPVNAQVSVTFAVKNRIVTVVGLVLYSYPAGEVLFRDTGMGMKFVKIDREDRSFLQQFIREKITEGIAPLPCR
jgi:CheY-like chemotaxis protein/Tfp pilus assembly protein PilZ